VSQPPLRTTVVLHAPPHRGAGVFQRLIHDLPDNARSITVHGARVWFAPCGAAVVPYDSAVAGTHRTTCPRCLPDCGVPDTPR
jgi:hypothetical protein